MPQQHSQVIPFTVRHEETLEKHDCDLYKGVDSDNPSITMRLDRIERGIAAVKWFTGAVVLAGLAAAFDIVKGHAH